MWTAKTTYITVPKTAYQQQAYQTFVIIRSQFLEVWALKLRGYVWAPGITCLDLGTKTSGLGLGNGTPWLGLGTKST